VSDNILQKLIGDYALLMKKDMSFNLSDGFGAFVKEWELNNVPISPDK
jgi:hypothetical protein